MQKFSCILEVKAAVERGISKMKDIINTSQICGHDVFLYGYDDAKEGDLRVTVP